MFNCFEPIPLCSKNSDFKDGTDIWLRTGKPGAQSGISRPMVEKVLLERGEILVYFELQAGRLNVSDTTKVCVDCVKRRVDKAVIISTLSQRL